MGVKGGLLFFVLYVMISDESVSLFLNDGKPPTVYQGLIAFCLIQMSFAVCCWLPELC